MSDSIKPSGSQPRNSQQRQTMEPEKKESSSQKPQKLDLYGTVPSESHASIKTRSSKLRKGDADGADSEDAPKKTVSQVAATISTKLTQSDVNRVISSQIQKHSQSQKSDKKESQESVKTNKRIGPKEESATPDISMTVSVEASKSSAATLSESVKRGAAAKANTGDQSKKLSKSASKKAAGKSTGGTMDLDKLIGVAAKAGSESAEKDTSKTRVEPEVVQSETYSPETNDIEQREALKTLLKNAADAGTQESSEREPIKIDDILKRKCHKEKVVSNVGGLASDYDIYFSHKPYEQQKLIAKYAITVLEKGRNGIYEAPPGTGKTVAMLSAVIGWLYQRQRAGKHLQTQIIYSVTDLDLTGPLIVAEIRKLCYKLKVATLDQEALKSSLTGAYKHLTTSPLLEEHYADSHILLVPADIVLSLGPFLNSNHILIVDEAQRTENWARSTIAVRGISSQIVGFPTNWEKRISEFVVPDKRKLANHPHVDGAILDSEELIKFLNSVFFEGKSNRERTIKSLGNALLRASNLLDKEAMTLIEENEEAGLTDEIDLLLSWQDLLLTVRELIKDSETVAIAPLKSASRGSGLGSFAQLKHYALHLQPKVGSEGHYSVRLVCISSALSLNPGKESAPWAKFYSCLMMSQSLFPIGLYQSVLNLQVDLGYQCPRLVSNCMRTFYCPTKLLPDSSVIARMQEVVRLIRTPCILEGTVVVVAQWKDVITLKEAVADGVFNQDTENGGYKDQKSQMIDEGDIVAMNDAKKSSSQSRLPFFFDTIEGAQSLDEYKQSVLSGKGGILVTSYAAPLRPTEKIDFPGKIGRVIIILGTPNIHTLPADPYASLVKKQMDELQKRSPQLIVPDVEIPQTRIGAKEWADKMIDRTVSEMMGLGLRDSDCHTAIIMLDEKYACNRKKLQQLPKWLLPTLESYQSLESIFLGVSTFLAAPTPLTTQDSAMREIREKLRKPTDLPAHIPQMLDPNFRVKELEEELRQLRMSITHPQWKRRGRKPANYGMGDFEDSLPIVQRSEPRNWREAERGSGIKRGEVEGVMKEFLGKRSPGPEQRSRRMISPGNANPRKPEPEKSRREIGKSSSHRDANRDGRERRERLQIQDTRNLLKEDKDQKEERERRGSKSERKRAEETDRRERKERDERKEERREERKDEKLKKDALESSRNLKDLSISPAQKQKLKKLFRDEAEEPEVRVPEKAKPAEILRSSGDRKKKILRDSSDSSSDFEVRGRDKFRPSSKLMAEQDRVQKTTTSSSSRREDGAHGPSTKGLISSRR